MAVYPILTPQSGPLTLMFGQHQDSIKNQMTENLPSYCSRATSRLTYCAKNTLSVSYTKLLIHVDHQKYVGMIPSSL